MNCPAGLEVYIGFGFRCCKNGRGRQEMFSSSTLIQSTYQDAGILVARVRPARCGVGCGWTVGGLAIASAAGAPTSRYVAT